MKTIDIIKKLGFPMKPPTIILKQIKAIP